MANDNNVLHEHLQWDFCPEEILTDEDLFFLGNYIQDNEEEFDEDEIFDPSLDF